MRINVVEKYGCVIVELKGNVMGGPDSEQFSELLHSFIDEGKKNVIVDLGSVKFMNSSGLGILIAGLTTMRRAEGDLRICQADNNIESLLVVTRLITVFDHYPRGDEAVQCYNGSLGEAIKVQVEAGENLTGLPGMKPAKFLYFKV